MNPPEFMKYTREELLNKEISNCKEIIATGKNVDEYEKLLSFLMWQKEGLLKNKTE